MEFRLFYDSCWVRLAKFTVKIESKLQSRKMGGGCGETFGSTRKGEAKNERAES